MTGINKEESKKPNDSIASKSINYRQDTLELILSEMLKESKGEGITKSKFWGLPEKYANKINVLCAELIDAMYEEGLNTAANDILKRI